MVGVAQLGIRRSRRMAGARSDASRGECAEPRMARPVLGNAKAFRQGWREENKVMVGVAQLVELRVVIPAVVGSNPIVHPNTRTVE